MWFDLLEVILIEVALAVGGSVSLNLLKGGLELLLLLTCVLLVLFMYINLLVEVGAPFELLREPLLLELLALLLFHALPAHFHLLFAHLVGLVGFGLFFAPLVLLALVDLALQRVDLFLRLC